MRIVKTSTLDFQLPERLIARLATEPRDAARLLVLRRATGQLEHCQVRNLPELGVLRAGDLLVVNQTKVLPARFYATREKTGGKVEGLFLSEKGHNLWHFLMQTRGSPTSGETLRLDAQSFLTLMEKRGGGEWLAQLNSNAPTLEVLGLIGTTPIPPYIRKARKQDGESENRPEDQVRYNTVFAHSPGSVAAPTAGLHFTQDLLARLETMGVRRAAITLHVGPGTFAPVKADDLSSHPIHSERIEVSAETIRMILETRAKGGRILAVGTTSVRCLESLPQDLTSHAINGYAGDTRLFIRPDDDSFQFRFTDFLLTNFHLPRSTLLALVAALPGVGLDRLLAAYREAVALDYRFYSYGDAMLVA